MFQSWKKSLIATAILGAAVSTTVANAEGKKVLNVGCEGAFAPFTYIDNDGNITGFDIDLIKVIGEDLGYEVKINVLPFDGLIPSLKLGNIDLIISGFTISEERAKQVAFTDPYYKSGISAIIRRADKDKYQKITDLSKSRLCAQIGTTGANAAKEISGNVGTYNTVPEAFMELKAKGCEAVVNDRPVNLYFLATKKDDSYVEIPELVSGENYGIITNKKNTELLQKLNSGLKKIRENGTFQKIHQKWFNVAE